MIVGAANVLQLLLIVVAGGSGGHAVTGVNAESAPKASVGPERWVVYPSGSSSGTACLIMEAVLRFSINYTTAPAGEWRIATFRMLNATSNSTDSSCNADNLPGLDSKAERLVLMFSPEREDGSSVVNPPAWRLEVGITCCNTSSTARRYAWAWVDLKYRVTPEMFPNVTDTDIGEHRAYAGGLQGYYGYLGAASSCYSDTVVELSGSDSITAQLLVSHLIYQPFRDRSAGTSGVDEEMDLPAYACARDDLQETTSEYVSIGVGIAVLTGVEFIIFVLLNWRYLRRSRMKSALTTDYTGHSGMNNAGHSRSSY